MNPYGSLSYVVSPPHIYVAMEDNFDRSDKAVIRNNIDGYKILRTKKFQTNWLTNPYFIGSFQTDKYVYFVFRESVTIGDAETVSFLFFFFIFYVVTFSCMYIFIVGRAFTYCSSM